MEYRKLILPGTCSVLYFLFNSMFILILIPLYIKTFHFTNELYGYSIAAYYGLYTLFSIPGGHLSDVFSRKTVIILGWFFVILGTFIVAFVDWRTLLISMSFIGLGAGLSGSAFQAYIADVVKSEELSASYGVTWGLSQMFPALGPLIIGYVVNYPLSQAAGIRYGIILSMTVIIAAAMFAVLLPKTGKRVMKKVPLSGKEKRIIMDFSFLYFVIGFGAGFSIPFYSIFFLEKFDCPALILGIIFAITTFAVSIATIFSGYLGERVDKLKFMLISNVFVLPAAVGIVIAPTLALSSFFYLLRMVLANMVWPVWSALLMMNVNHHIKGKAWGITSAAWGISYMVSSAMGGHMFNLFGGWVFVLAAVIYLAVICFVVNDLKKH
ncbi:MAG: MFS transporter [Thermoplasmatales archaeon]|nr:MFS transporter [Thermoplasmatales archaeon]